MALALDRVGVAFGGFQALNDVSLTVAPGQVVGLIGPNGAGKTTCVNTLTGFQRPSTGRVLLGGRDVSRLAAPASCIGSVSLGAGRGTRGGARGRPRGGKRRGLH